MQLNFIFLFLTLLAEIIGTVGGFGSSVFFVPIGNFYFDFHTVLGLTAIFHIFSNASKIFLFKKGLNKKLLLNIGVPSVIFVILGGILSKYLQSFYLELFLCIFLIVLSLVFLIRKNLVLPANRKIPQLADHYLVSQPDFWEPAVPFAGSPWPLSTWKKASLSLLLPP